MTDCLPETVCAVVMWDGDQWRESDDIVYGPSHWLPLPSAPNQAKEAGE